MNNQPQRHALALAVICLFCTQGVTAQTATTNPDQEAKATSPQPPSLPTQQEALPEIKVIGTRDAATTRSLTSSTTRINVRQAEDLGLTDLRQAIRLMGNTSAAPSNNGNNGISIRGINSEGVGEPGANSRPLSTLVIDGATQSVEGVRRGQRGTWDIEDIEVVRGPQSTLQGRNTLAGSVVVKTADPTDTWEGATRLTVGEGRLRGPALMLSGPITDEWSFRVADERLWSNKGIEHSTPAASFLDDDSYRNSRFKLRYQPAWQPGLTFKLTVSDTMDDPAVTAITLRRAGTGGVDGCPPVLTAADRYFCVTETAAERRLNKVRNRVLDINYQLAPGITLQSVTAHVRTDAFIDGVGAFKNQPYVRDEVRTDRDTTQLLRYSYNPEGSVWNGEAGVFLGRFTNERDSFVTVGGKTQQDIYGKRSDNNAAVFGEVRWTFKPEWQLVLGGRYEVEYSRKHTDLRSDGERERTRYDNDVFLPKVGVIRDLGGSDTLAFSVSTGYRGGFREVEAVNDAYDVDPEFLTSYDLAYRSRWLDGKLTLNLNVFYNEWKDQQVSVNKASANTGQQGDTGSATVLMTTLNAGRSHQTGAELDMSWRLARRITLGGSIGVLSTRFDDFPFGNGNLRGNEFPEAPRLSGGLWLQARAGSGWVFSSQVQARSGAYATSDIFNIESRKVPGYAVVGLGLGYETQHWEAMLNADNVFDRVYLNGRDFRSGAYVGDPRRLTLALTARF